LTWWGCSPSGRRLLIRGFRLHCDNADHVVEICRRVDGLPLGIELAAAQLRTLSIEQLAAALRTPSHVVQARRATPADHRSLAATFDWSYALCSPAEQALWRRMSVFVGSFELAAPGGSTPPGSDRISRGGLSGCEASSRTCGRLWSSA
jgi:predicted ATPase